MTMKTATYGMHLSTLVIGAMLSTLFACRNRPGLPLESSNTGFDDSAIIHVRLSRPILLKTNQVALSGLVEATQRTDILTRTSAFVSSMKVNVGDKVSRGDVLATLSADDLHARQAQARAAVAQAQASFENAKKDLDRYIVLNSQQSATKKELDNATLAMNIAHAQLDAARQGLKEALTSDAYAVLRAPFSGTITHRYQDKGSMALPGSPILSLEGSGSYRISAMAPENIVKLIKRGSRAEISIKALGNVLNGSVDRFSQSSASNGGQYLVQIALKEKAPSSLHGGMFADVRLQLPESTIENRGANISLYIPSSSIQHKGQLNVLYSCSSTGHTLLRMVRLGNTRGDLVEVLSGLGKNDSFIVSADRPLTGGAAVKVDGTHL